MIVTWWGYGIAVAAALAVAGWLGERHLRAAGRPGRWAWLATMSFSLLWPLVVVAGWLPFAPLRRLDLVAVAGVGPAAPVDVVVARGEYLGTLPSMRLPDAFGPDGRVAWMERGDEVDVQRVVVRRFSLAPR